ncbi:hypothetical protein [Bacillus sp. FJAT-44742]|uniref:hypothetical protein n=1 Tax=Bacillus sp. FJAT-44742 TaxID=2014005 RepID=UPI000C2390D9|nr:hypothetical protein [Bacillus sp. FJAT-44742]
MIPMVKRSFIIIMCLLYFIASFSQSTFIYSVLSIVILLTFFLSIVHANKKTMIMGSVLFVAGTVINLTVNQGTVMATIEGMQQNLPLVVLMTLAPLLAIPITNSSLMGSIQQVLKQMMDSPNKLFAGLASFLAAITPVLSVGSVKLLHDIVRENKFSSAFLARAYFVGFSTAMVWSPYFGSVALTLYYLNIPFGDYILIGLVLAFLQLGVGMLLFLSSKDKETQKLSSPSAKMSVFPLVSKVIILLGSLIGVLVVLESITGLPMLLLVSLTSIIIPILWSLGTNSWRVFFYEGKAFFNKLDYGVNTEIVLFLSAGLFGSALAASPFSVYISNAFQALSSISFLLVGVIVVLFVSLMAFVGIHQIITVPLLAMQVSPEALGADPISLAVVFLLAWFLSSILSPFNAITIFISQAVHKDTITVGFKWNGSYVAVMFVVGMVFVALLHYGGSFFTN